MRVHLEHLLEAAGAGQRTHAAPDGSIISKTRQPRGRQRLGQLEPPSQTVLWRRQVLQGRLCPAAPPPDTQHVAGATDPPVVGIEVHVDKPLGHRRRDLEPRYRRRDRGARSSRDSSKPALHRPQVQRVELPLDLDVGVSSAFGRRHPDQCYPSIAADRIAAARFGTCAVPERPHTSHLERRGGLRVGPRMRGHLPQS